MNNDEAKKELDKVKGIEAAVDRENLVYRATEYTIIFKNVRTRKRLVEIFTGVKLL